MLLITPVKDEGLLCVHEKEGMLDSIRVCVGVCMCVKERETEIDRDTQRQTDTHIERHTHRDGYTHSESERNGIRP